MSLDPGLRYLPRERHTMAGCWEALFRRLAYHFWRRRLKRFAALSPAAPLRVVDLGCGPGFLLHAIHGWFPPMLLTGVDRSAALLRVAQSLCPAISVLEGDAAAIPLDDGAADVLFALHVVEHLPRPELLFREAHRVLRTDGMLLMATPNPEGLGARLMGARWSGYSDPTHISLHGESFWLGQLEAEGFAVIRHGTTSLSGLPLLGQMPLALLHWIPTFFCGHFPWRYGEACVVEAMRRSDVSDPAKFREVTARDECSVGAPHGC